MFQFLRAIAFFPVHRHFINKLLSSWYFFQFPLHPFHLHPTKSQPRLPFSFQTDQRGNLIEFEKEWETAWEVFPELSDNPREPTTISITSHTTTHTSTSFNTHYSTSHITLTVISHNHLQTISYTNITTSNNTPKLAQTTHTTSSTTTTSFFEPVTFSKQVPSKNKILMKKFFTYHQTKGTPTNIRHFPFQRYSTQRHKKYSLPFRQPQTSLTATYTSNSKSSTSISTTTATKLPPKSRILPPTNPKLTHKHSTFITDFNTSRPQQCTQ